MNALLIVNPRARRVAAQPALPTEIQARLRQVGVEAHLLLTRQPGDATAAARNALGNGFDAVVVAGGDGTVNEAVNGLAGTSTPLGLIPLGTGNILGEYLNLHTGDIAGACEIIGSGVARPIDLGIVNGRYFANMAGVGLDAQIASDTEGPWKSLLGRLAFVAQFVHTLTYLRPWQFEADVDGRHLAGEMWGALLCNTAQYTWRVRLVPEARDDDGELDFVFLRGCRVDELQRSVAALFVLGESAAQQPSMEVVRGRRLRLTTPVPAPWQVDGEALGHTPVDCEVRPRCLYLMQR